MSTIAGDYVSIALGGWLRRQAATPSRPTITVANDETGTSATVTVDGDAGVTNRLYYRLLTDSSWTVGSTRSGDGDIQQTGLSALWYEFQVVSDDSGTYSLPSVPVRLRIYDPDATGVMAPEEALVDILNDADVVGDRNYSTKTPKNPTTPYGVIQRVAGGEQNTLEGGAGFAHPRLQITYWDTTTSGAHAAAAAAKTALSGFSGTADNGSDLLVIGAIYVVDSGQVPGAPMAGPEVATLFGFYVDVLVMCED